MKGTLGLAGILIFGLMCRAPLFRCSGYSKVDDEDTVQISADGKGNVTEKSTPSSSDGRNNSGCSSNSGCNSGSDRNNSGGNSSGSNSSSNSNNDKKTR